MKTLELNEMSEISGSGYWDNFLWGFCIVGSFANPVVAVGCVGYAIYDRFG
jgi:hypothetical protein